MWTCLICQQSLLQQNDQLTWATAGQGLEFTEASEFARSIQLREPDEGAARPDDSADHMDVKANAGSSAAERSAASAAQPPKRKAKSK